MNPAVLRCVCIYIKYRRPYKLFLCTSFLSLRTFSSWYTCTTYVSACVHVYIAWITACSASSHPFIIYFALLPSAPSIALCILCLPYEHFICLYSNSLAGQGTASRSEEKRTRLLLNSLLKRYCIAHTVPLSRLV